MNTSTNMGLPVLRPGEVEDGAEIERRASGVALLAVGASFLIVSMLAASMAPGYDFHGGAISDLGVIAATAMLFNILLVAIGTLNAVAGYLSYRSHRNIWLLAMYLLAGVGAVGAGFFPLDTGGAHTIFALLAFVFFNLEALGTAAVTRGLLRLLSAAAGAVGLVYVVVMVIGDGGNPSIFGAIGHGGSERMIAYPAMIWTLVFGGYLIAQPEPRPPMR